MKTFLGIIRAPFLPESILCGLFGIAYANHLGYNIDILNILLILIGALLGHILVNVLNELYDFKSGLDFETKRTPFNGGSGALIENPSFYNKGIIIATVSLIGIVAVGSYFIYYKSYSLLILGAMGILISFLYTPVLNKNGITSVLSAGIGFGVVIGSGAFIAASSVTNLNAFLVVLPLVFLVSNLNLMNHFSDAEADKKFGRKTFPVTLGKEKTIAIVLIHYILAIVSLSALISVNILPLKMAFAFAPLLLFPVVITNLKQFNNPEKVVKAQATNVVINLSFPLVSSIILFL